MELQCWGQILYRIVTMSNPFVKTFNAALSKPTNMIIGTMHGDHVYIWDGELILILTFCACPEQFYLIPALIIK